MLEVSHIYKAAGLYSVAAQVTDDEGPSREYTQIEFEIRFRAHDDNRVRRGLGELLYINVSVTANE